MPYRWMLVVRKSNFVPLAPGIQPLPAHLARKPERKELETAIPVAGSAFGDGQSPYQWAEFETVDVTRHHFTPVTPPTKVNLTLDTTGQEQVWYYLGRQSTESRAQYTHNPSVPIHNPRANFLDSVKSLTGVGTVGPVGAARASKISPHHHFYYGSPATATALAPPYQQNLYPHHQHRLLHQRSGFLNVSPHLQRRPPTSTAPTTATAAAAPSLQHLAPPPHHLTPAAAAAAGAAAAGPAMPSAFRTLSNHSARHAPYPSVAKSHAQQQHHHLPSTNTFANVRELIARRRLAQITEHANVFAGYTIVSPELVVETLLGPMGSIPPANGLEKLELAMAQQRVQPRAADGTLLPPQTLNMRSEEVTRLLQMLRFSLVSHRERLDVIQKKESEGVKQDTIDRGSVAAAKMPGKYAFLDQQRALAPNVYQSPYNMPSGFSEYAKTNYSLMPSLEDPPKESMANDYFNSLSQEDKEKIMKTCGGFVQRSFERSASHSRHSSTASNLRLSTALAQQAENPTIDITTVDDPPLAGLDLPLHVDSPCSSFGRSHLRFQSPNEFPLHGPDPHPDHDLFGDQQANTRFWQNGPWIAGDGNTPNDETRPFFGPHERLKHDYASSDISLGKGPGSLHSVDMAGFGLDPSEELCAGLSP